MTESKASLPASPSSSSPSSPCRNLAVITAVVLLCVSVVFSVNFSAIENSSLRRRRGNSNNSSNASGDDVSDQVAALQLLIDAVANDSTRSIGSSGAQMMSTAAAATKDGDPVHPLDAATTRAPGVTNNSVARARRGDAGDAALAEIINRTFLLAVHNSTTTGTTNQQDAAFHAWLGWLWSSVVHAAQVGDISVYELRAGPQQHGQQSNQTARKQWVASLLSRKLNTARELRALHTTDQLLRRSSVLRNQRLFSGFIVDPNAADFTGALRKSWKLRVEENRTFVSFASRHKNHPLSQQGWGIITSVYTDQLDLDGNVKSSAQKFGRVAQRLFSSESTSSSSAPATRSSSSSNAVIHDEGKRKPSEILFEIVRGVIGEHHFPLRSGDPLFEFVDEKQVRIGPPVSVETRPFLGLGVPKSQAYDYVSYAQRRPQRFTSEQLCPPDLRLFVHIPLYWSCFEKSRAVRSSNASYNSSSFNSSSNPDSTATPPPQYETYTECPRLNVFERVLFHYLSTIQYNTTVFVHVHREKMPTLPPGYLEKLQQFPRGQVLMVDHPCAEHPFHLAWKPRRLIANQIGLFDLVLYTEDDIGFTQRNLALHCSLFLKVQSFGQNARLGFLRVEKSMTERYPSDRDALDKKIVFIGEEPYFYMSGISYAAFWIMTGSDVRVAVRKPMWLYHQERYVVKRCYGAWKAVDVVNHVDRRACGWPGMAREEAVFFHGPMRVLEDRRMDSNNPVLIPIDNSLTVLDQNMSKICIAEAALYEHVNLDFWSRYQFLRDVKTKKKRLEDGICFTRSEFDSYRHGRQGARAMRSRQFH